MGADSAEDEKGADEIKFKTDDWLEIGMVSIIYRRVSMPRIVPASEKLTEQYPDLREAILPGICYFDIDRNGAYASQALADGKTTARIGVEYFKAAKHALKLFAAWIREHPDTEISKEAKYLFGVSRLGSEELGARLGFDIFTDAVVEDENMLESVNMAQDLYQKSGMSEDEAKAFAAKHKASIAVMPIARLLETY